MSSFSHNLCKNTRRTLHSIPSPPATNQTFVYYSAYTQVSPHNSPQLYNPSGHYATTSPSRNQMFGTYLNSILPLRKMRRPLLLLLALNAGLVLRQAPPDGPSLLRAQVQRQVFLVLVEDAELRALVGVDDGEDASDGFAEVVAVLRKRGKVLAGWWLHF